MSQVTLGSPTLCPMLSVPGSFKAIILLLFLAVPAGAEETKLMVTLAAGDLVSTELALASGATEANPLMRERAARFFVKGATTAAIVVISKKLDHDGHKTEAKVLRWGFIAVQSVVIAHNLRTRR